MLLQSGNMRGPFLGLLEIVCQGSGDVMYNVLAARTTQELVRSHPFSRFSTVFCARAYELSGLTITIVNWEAPQFLQTDFSAGNRLLWRLSSNSIRVDIADEIKRLNMYLARILSTRKQDFYEDAWGFLNRFLMVFQGELTSFVIEFGEMLRLCRGSQQQAVQSKRLLHHPVLGAYMRNLCHLIVTLSLTLMTALSLDVGVCMINPLWGASLEDWVEQQTMKWETKGDDLYKFLFRSARMRNPFWGFSLE
eukprot:714381-Hanusia_phi.AAC.1